MSEALLQVALTGLRGRRYRFTPALPNRVGRDVAGLYARWLSCFCLYVGMSTSIGMRLYQHRVQQHNDRLAAHLKAWWKDIETSVIAIPGVSRDCLLRIEQRAISALHPCANISIPRAS